MIYYISNAPEGLGDNANAGTSPDAPWKDFAPVHQRSLEPGDKILLQRGSCWNQQLVINDSGTREAWCELGAYGEGPRPRIIRNGDALERGLRMNDPSFWVIRDLEVGCCGCGILITFTTPGHEGLVLKNLFVHDCYGIFIRDMGDGPARRQAQIDHIGIASGIHITCDPMDLQPGEIVLRDVYIDGVEGCHNADSLSINPGGRSVREEISYPMRDIVINHLNLHEDDAPNPGGIPDSLRFVRCEHVLLINSSLDRCCGRFTTSGTAMMFMGGIKDLTFVNNIFTRTPDSGSVDQCAIDFEATTRQVKIRNNFFGYNAGPGIEFLDIWGETSYSEAHEVSGNAFEGNGRSTHGGQDGSGGIHHYGGNFATGVIRDNLVYEPGRPLYHGEFIKFDLVNNLKASEPMSNAMHSFGEQGDGGWRYQIRSKGHDWRDMQHFDADLQVWQEGDSGPEAWVSRYELCSAAADTTLARAWVAPRDGSVAVRGRAVKWQSESAPVNVRVTRNGETVVDEQPVPIGEWGGIETNLDGIAVQAGDVLRFEVTGGANDQADAVSWAPTVAYIG